MALFEETGHLEEMVTFPSGTLRYVLERSSALDTRADFVNGSITVSIPLEAARQWVSTSQVGIEASYNMLDILIEKDFQCAHGPADEDAYSSGDIEIAG